LCQEREKIDWQEPRKFDCRLVRTIFIFCCPLPIFTKVDFGEWPENQILIPDWTYFHCLSATLIAYIQVERALTKAEQVIGPILVKQFIPFFLKSKQEEQGWVAQYIIQMLLQSLTLQCKNVTVPMVQWV